MKKFALYSSIVSRRMRQVCAMTPSQLRALPTLHHDAQLTATPHQGADSHEDGQPSRLLEQRLRDLRAMDEAEIDEQRRGVDGCERQMEQQRLQRSGKEGERNDRAREEIREPADDELQRERFQRPERHAVHA